MSVRDTSVSRRRFVQFLAASPLFAGSTGILLAQTQLPKQRSADPLAWMPHDPGVLIKDPKEAISVFDFEPVARQNIPPAHFGYMASGVNDEVTLRANREGFAKFQLRPRRLVDVSKVDMSVDFFGTRYPSPIILAPIGGQKAFHPDGEVACARAAKTGEHLQILSTVTTSGVEDVAAARRAGLVPAVCIEQLGYREGAGGACRARGLPGGRGHRRHHGQPRPGHAAAFRAERHA